MWKNSSQCLSLHNLEVNAPIGVFDFEKVNLNKFLVSIDIWGDYEACMHSDSLSETLDYTQVANIVDQNMAAGCDLIEHIASKILNEISQINFPMNKLRIQIQKLNPPLEQKVGATSFELIMEK